ncbi:MAG: hypothetical protein AAGB93_10290, partial [Planctomycetota bacterium]
MTARTERLRFYSRLDADPRWHRSRSALRPSDAARFPGDGLVDAIGRALSERGATSPKELLEATEVFALARKVVRRPVVADLCCGHGLAGILFAALERSVERVVLVDRERPPSADAVLEAVGAVAPWVPPKVEWRTQQLKRVELEPATGVLAIHACGLRTDAAMEISMRAGGPFAALPCCRPHRAHPALDGLKQALGADVAIDVHRTYALERAGYRVAWRDISPTITPMHRVLLARPRAAALGRREGARPAPAG